MAKSKKSKSRKKKVTNYKTKHKAKNKFMSEKHTNAPVNFKWEPDAKIELTGEEFAVLNSFVKQFEMPIMVANTIFNRMVKDGVARPADENGNYLERNGKPVKQEEPLSVPHTVTQEDLDGNPDLVAAGVKVGEVIHVAVAPLTPEEEKATIDESVEADTEKEPQPETTDKVVPSPEPEDTVSEEKFLNQVSETDKVE